MNRNCGIFSLTLVLFFAIDATLAAQQSTATSTVVFEVREINQISISGSPEPLVVNRSVPGEGISVAIDDGTTWTLTTNGSNQKITAFLDAPMPAGVSLAVDFSAPEGATATGSVALSALAQTLVGKLATLQAADLQVTYTLSATPEAGVVGPDSRTITYTIIAES